jgi:5-methyltetrahydrofolate--homocysteine methyltransferase
MHVEVIRAVMGADVMLGHDPDCARWIRRFRDTPSSSGAGAAAAAAATTGEAPRGRREGGHRRRPA